MRNYCIRFNDSKILFAINGKLQKYTTLRRAQLAIEAHNLTNCRVVPCK